MRGTVKFYNIVRRFGFIVSDDGSGDVLVTELVKSKFHIDKLDAGDRVEFDIEVREGGRLRAITLQKLSDAQSFAATPPPQPWPARALSATRARAN